MSISSINGVGAYSAVTAAETESKAAKAAETTDKQVKEDAAVFEKSQDTKKDSANQIYNRDNVIAKLKADQQTRLDSMNSLVQKLLGKQAEKFNLATGTNLAATFREIAGKVDQQTIDDAKASIAEDGYWGIEQTSDRLVSMAIALSGGDTSKADLMMESLENGYKQATKAWARIFRRFVRRPWTQPKRKWKTGKTVSQQQRIIPSI